MIESINIDFLFSIFLFLGILIGFRYLKYYIHKII